MNQARQLADRAQDVRRPGIGPDALAAGERVRVQPQLVSSPQAVNSWPSGCSLRRGRNRSL